MEKNRTGGYRIKVVKFRGYNVFYYQLGLRGTKQCVIGLYGESFGVQAVQRNGSAKDSDIQNRKSSDES